MSQPRSRPSCGECVDEHGAAPGHGAVQFPVRASGGSGESGCPESEDSTSRSPAASPTRASRAGVQPGLVQQLAAGDLDVAAALRQVAHAGRADSRHGVGGVGVEDPVDAVVAGPVGEPLALGRAQVPGGEHHVGVRDQGQHRVGGLSGARVDRRNGVRVAGQPWLLVAQPWEPGGLLGVGVGGRHPRHPAPRAQRGGTADGLMPPTCWFSAMPPWTVSPVAWATARARPTVDS